MPRRPGAEARSRSRVEINTLAAAGFEEVAFGLSMITPPHGLVLDPFAGTGTTAEACIHEHMRCICIEREADYLPLSKARLGKPMQIGFDFG